MLKNKNNVVVLGGGIAGLTAALRMLELGIPVTVIERENEVGGLSRTLSYKNYLFDFSAHRFNSDNPNVLKRFKLLVGKHCIKNKKKSYIQYWNQYFTYPPKAIELIKKMPVKILVPSAIDFFISLIKKGFNKQPILSFQDWTRASFGKTLSQQLNEKYAEKIWKTPSDQLSCDWASIRIGKFNLVNFLIALFLPGYYKKVYTNKDPDADSFYYCDEGIGLLPRRMEEKIIEKGGLVLRKSIVTRIIKKNNNYQITYSQNGHLKTISSKIVFSSIPLDILTSIINPTPPKIVQGSVKKLGYLGVIIVNVLINKNRVTDAHWIYFPERNTIFNYIVEFKNWSNKMTPPNKTSLSANITCRLNSKLWKMNDIQLIEQVINQLQELSLIGKKDVIDSFVYRLPYAYPVMLVGYRDNLERIKRYFQSLPNFHLLGRTGNFDYANADIVMEKSIDLVDKIFKNLPKPSSSS